MRGDQGLDDGQAQSRTLSAALSRGLRKALEGVGLKVRVKARPGIADAECDPVLALLIRFGVHLNAQPVAVAGMAQHIADQVAGDLAQPVCIGANVRAAVALLHGKVQ